MVFSSLPFLFLFLPAVLLVSHLLPFRLRNGFLLLANLFFYAYGEPIYVLVMIGSIVVNYTCGRMIRQGKRSEKKAGRRILIVGIVLNLAALGVFKYSGLFLDTLRGIPGLGFLPEAHLALPIGISFYTFQAVSYLIDVYWRDCEPADDFIRFAAYISLFPQLIAGPIVRYRDVDEQLISRRESLPMFREGVQLFVVGLGKKVLLANQFGQLWDLVSADPTGYGTLAAWCGAIAYTLQIYFDFSGYSDMARGLGKMLGFDFCINFNYPYISRSVTEFWRRWHISLSSWFRDYVYIPLGGNRCSPLRQGVNIMIVWGLTGFWHGAGWNFLFWGLYYGVLLLVEKNFLGKRIRRLRRPLQHLYAMFIAVIGWVFFASPDLGSAMHYLSVMFIPHFGTASAHIGSWLPLFLIGAIAATPFGSRVWKLLKERPAAPVLEGAGCLLLLLLCTACLVSSSYNPFLYFRF